MLIELLKLYSVVTLFLGHCAVIGYAGMQWLSLWRSADSYNENNYLKYFFAISLGIVANIILVFILGIVDYLHIATVLGFGLCLLMASVFSIYPKKKSFFKFISEWDVFAFVIPAVCLAITLLSAMHPPGHWDDTMYHLPLARSYLQHQGIVLNEYLRFPLFPQNVNLLIALGLLLGGDLMAQAFATLPLFVIAIGLLGAARWLTGSIVIGVFSIVTLFLIAPVKDNLGYAYIDNGLALFCWGVILAIAQWVEIRHTKYAYGWIILAGIFAGAAIGTKYFGAVFAALAGVYLLFYRAWKSILIFAITAGLVGCGWYIRSFVISGDPFHPVGGNIFGYFLWNADDLLAQKSEQASFGVRPASLDIPSALNNVGLHVWWLAILSLMLIKINARVRYFQFVFVAYLLFWFFVTQVNRYLAPIYAVGIFLSWYTIYRCYPLTFFKDYVDTRSQHVHKILVWLIMLLPLGFVLIKHYESACVQTSSQWNNTLEKTSGYTLFSRANTLIEQHGARMMNVGFENAVYFFKGTVIGDWFGPGRYANMMECSNNVCSIIAPDKMKLLMGQFGAGILVVSTVSFPNFDAQRYGEYFDFVLADDNGVLMTLKANQ